MMELGEAFPNLSVGMKFERCRGIESNHHLCYVTVASLHIEIVLPDPLQTEVSVKDLESPTSSACYWLPSKLLVV